METALIVDALELPHNTLRRFSDARMLGIIRTPAINSFADGGAQLVLSDPDIARRAFPSGLLYSLEGAAVAEYHQILADPRLNTPLVIPHVSLQGV